MRAASALHTKQCTIRHCVASAQGRHAFAAAFALQHVLVLDLCAILYTEMLACIVTGCIVAVQCHAKDCLLFISCVLCSECQHWLKLSQMQHPLNKITPMTLSSLSVQLNQMCCSLSHKKAKSLSKHQAVPRQ